MESWREGERASKRRNMCQIDAGKKKGYEWLSSWYSFFADFDQGRVLSDNRNDADETDCEPLN